MLVGVDGAGVEFFARFFVALLKLQKKCKKTNKIKITSR